MEEIPHAVSEASQRGANVCVYATKKAEQAFEEFKEMKMLSLT